jgi:hypothetical protein
MGETEETERERRERRGVRDRARHPRGDHGAAASFGEQRGRGALQSLIVAQWGGREVLRGVVKQGESGRLL